MADEFPHIIRIEIRDINGAEKTIYSPLNSIESATEFRKWADLKVYGDFTVAGYREVTHHHSVRYVPDNDGFLKLKAVEHHQEPSQETTHAVLRAEIGWFNPAGFHRHFNDDALWPDMREEATRITIRPGDQQLLVELPMPPAGPQAAQQTGQLVGPHAGPQYGPLTFQLLDPLSDPQSGPQYSPLTLQLFDPQSGPQSGPDHGPELNQLTLQLFDPVSDTQSGPQSDPQSGPEYGPLSLQLFNPISGPQSDPQSGLKSQTGPLSSTLSGPH